LRGIDPINDELIEGIIKDFQSKIDPEKLKPKPEEVVYAQTLIAGGLPPPLPPKPTLYDHFTEEELDAMQVEWQQLVDKTPFYRNPSKEGENEAQRAQRELLQPSLGRQLRSKPGRPLEKTAKKRLNR
jgi:hypothetical protein